MRYPGKRQQYAHPEFALYGAGAAAIADSQPSVAQFTVPNYDIREGEFRPLQQ